MIHPAVAIGTEPSILDRLADPAVRLVVWERSNPSRNEGYPCYAEPTMPELSCLPDWLNGDIAMLGDLYRRLTGEPWKVRLETAEERTCPGFHEDAVALRFIVTYRGPGTEWTTDDQSGVIHQVPVGAVAAMKGRGWPSDQRILHRSAKASRRNPRWVLAMDAAVGEGGRGMRVVPPGVLIDA